MTAATASPAAGGTHRAHRSTPGYLGEALSSSDNALNFVRLCLAVAVIFGHAFPLGGVDALTIGPFAHGGLHGFAVEGFFVISGYLILASGIRTSTGAYLWRRFLRIYPGYIVALLATALVFAPLGALLESDARWEVGSAASYIVGALDLKPSQDGVGQTLLHVPWPETWNGSLWTLFYEAAAYIGVALLVAWGPVRRRLKVIVPLGASVGTALYLVVPGDMIMGLIPGAVGGIIVVGTRLWTFFAWGMLAYLWRDRIPVRTSWIILSWFIFLVTAHLAVGGAVAVVSKLLLIPALAYAVLATGAALRIRLGQKNDISYGVYVYAFPIQQMLALMNVHQYGWFVTAILALILTIPFAIASWMLIEKPALSLKNHVRNKR